MAIENGPFIGDFPIRNSIHRGFSIAMFDYQRVLQCQSVRVNSNRERCVCAREGKAQDDLCEHSDHEVLINTYHSMIGCLTLSVHSIPWLVLLSMGVSNFETSQIRLAWYVFLGVSLAN